MNKNCDITSNQNNELKRSPRNLGSKIGSICGMILFFLMLVFPRSYQTLKSPFLLICVIGIVFVILYTGKLKLHKFVFIFFIVYILYGTIWGLYGHINDKEYANDFLRLNVMWVFIYLILVSGLTREKQLESIQKIMIWATLVISVYNINYYLYSIGLPHLNLLVNLDMGQRIGIHSGYVQLTAHNIGSLFFLIPFLFSGLSITNGKRGRFVGFSPIFLKFVILLGVFASFLSGRRMLWLVIGMMFIMYYLSIRISNSSRVTLKQMVKVIVGIGSVIFAIQFTFFKKIGFDYKSFIDRLTFSGDQAEGTIYRITKMKDMATEVYEKNIFLGTGGGSPAFEMTFIQTYHETGLIGLTIYLGLFLWTFLMIIFLLRKRIGRKESGIPILVGSFSFFLSIWSNPYFGSFDFMWALFLPITYINIFLIRGIK